MAYLVPDVIETVGLRAKSWNWRQQTKLPESALGLPSVVPLGVPLALTVWMLTRMLANPVVVSAARDTRSSWPLMPAVKVWARKVIWRWELMVRVCDWSSVSVVACAGTAMASESVAASAAANEPRLTLPLNEFFT